jgi:hypothetical protein
MFHIKTFFRRHQQHQLLHLDMRPTVQLTSQPRFTDPSAPRFELKPALRGETPLRCAESHGTGSGQGAVSRLQALIETRSSHDEEKNKSEIVIFKCPQKELSNSQVEIDLKSETKLFQRESDKNRVTSVRKKISDGDNYADLKHHTILFSTKSVPNLFDKTHVSQLQNIDSTNLSVSLPFDLNEISDSAPQPCQVTEYDDFFTLDQTVLQRSERRSLTKCAALRYRSSIRIMVRPEAGAAVSANPECSGERIPPNVPIRSIVKEQFR